MKQMSPSNCACRKQENQYPFTASYDFQLTSESYCKSVCNITLWLCGNTLIVRLLCVIEETCSLHNNSTIIQASFSEERYYIYMTMYPDPQIICNSSEGLSPPLSLSWKLWAGFQNITVFWMRGLFWISLDTSRWHHITVKSNEPYWKSVQAAIHLWEVFFSLAPAVSSQFLIKPQP